MEVRQFTNISCFGSTTCTLTVNKDSEGLYIRKETLICAFQLDEEEGVGIGPFGSSDYVVDEPKFRLDPSISRWEVLGVVDVDVSTPSLEILSEEVGNPELIFLNVKLDFDLQKNSASIKSERQLDAIISFPNTAMETSIPDAVWLLEDSIVIMKKPENRLNFVAL